MSSPEGGRDIKTACRQRRAAAAPPPEACAVQDEAGKAGGAGGEKRNVGRGRRKDRAGTGQGQRKNRKGQKGIKRGWEEKQNRERSTKRVHNQSITNP